MISGRTSLYKKYIGVPPKGEWHTGNCGDLGQTFPKMMAGVLLSFTAKFFLSLIYLRKRY